MAEYSALAPQIVNPGESIVFSNAPVPCRMGLVNHREDSGNFLLSGLGNVPFVNGCGCNCVRPSAVYLVDFGANVSIPTGGTVEAISVAMALDGNTLPESTMTVTPAAVEEEFNISRAINVAVWHGCCQTFSIRNTSTQPIQVSAANVIFGKPTLTVVD